MHFKLIIFILFVHFCNIFQLIPTFDSTLILRDYKEYRMIQEIQRRALRNAWLLGNYKKLKTHPGDNFKR